MNAIHRPAEVLRITRFIPRLSFRSVVGQRRYLAQHTSAPDYAVLGAGITGLATAYYLRQKDPRCKVTIYEASDRIGGWVGSKRVSVPTGDVVFESGPRSLRPGGNGILSCRLANELDLLDDTIFTPKTSAAAQYRYLYYPDHLVSMPNPSLGLVNNLLNVWREPIFKGLPWALISEPLKDRLDSPPDDESLGSYFGRRFGKSVVDNILSAIIHGIYAGDVDQLSAKSLFPRQFRYQEEPGSIIAGMLDDAKPPHQMTKREADFIKSVTESPYTWKKPSASRSFSFASVFTFKEGIGQITDGLARHLWSDRNVQIKTSTPIAMMRLAEQKDRVELSIGERKVSHDRVVSTLSPTSFDYAVDTSDKILPKIPAVTVMTVNLFYEKQEALPPGPGEKIGFGYLIPRATPFEQNPERALGVVFDHAYAPPATETGVSQDKLSSPGTKVTVMLGGHWWNDWTSYPTEEDGLEMARAIMKRHLNITQEPAAWAVNLHRQCIPQYIVGHEARLKTAHEKLLKHFSGAVRVAGSWISGVGVNDCLRSAWDVVQALDKDNATGLEHVGNDQWVRVSFTI